MRRSPTAPLSLAEIASLRQLAADAGRSVPDSHRSLLLAMGLIAQPSEGAVVVTDLGLKRLAQQAHAVNWPRAKAANPFAIPDSR